MLEVDTAVLRLLHKDPYIEYLLKFKFHLSTPLDFATALSLWGIKFSKVKLRERERRELKKLQVIFHNCQPVKMILFGFYKQQQRCVQAVFS